MTINNKKRAILCLAGAALLIYLLWLFLRPVDIVAVYKRGRSSTAILVRNFPFTAKGKINWWLENRTMLNETYSAPYLDKDGTFWVTFFLFGDGYQKDKIDERLCFDEIKSDLRCIDKNAVMTVFSSRDNQTFFRVNKGKYILRNNGDVDKVE